MFRAIDPTNGETVREVPLDDAAAVEHKLETAARAFRSWRDTALPERAERLRRVAALLREEVEKLAPLMTQEMGKPIREARGEVEKCAWCAEHYADHAAEYLAPLEIASDATRSYVQHLPLGPVVGILPWNAPFWIAFRVCAPALMAGNVVLLKHDPHVPGCAKAITDVFARAGLPEGVLQDLVVDVKGAERALRDRRVRAASFTGSARGGGAVAAVTGSE
ncbi:MAG: aldehyde dehydrogenase family protein, partial [Myxococcota bacterium]|nr:aldehyde dehydrogenase family protein [Myxococcota bacterium]